MGSLINEPGYSSLVTQFGRQRVVDAIREQVGTERGGEPAEPDERLVLVEARLRAEAAPRLRRVINASGVILHTNLGRAPLSKAAVDAITRTAASYSNLEVDLVSGKRGERADLVRDLLCALFDCESALVVNNNAAAVLLALTALCKGKEVVVGERVNIKLQQIVEVWNCVLSVKVYPAIAWIGLARTVAGRKYAA